MTPRGLAVGTLGLLALLGGCARREYLIGPALTDVQRQDPELQLLRVYPSRKFVVYYARDVSQDLEVGGQQGEVQTGYRGQRVEMPVGKSLAGAIVAVDQRDDVQLLWVSFDARCRERGCAFGFVLSDDQRYRLAEVPKLQGFSEPEVYKRNVSDRHLMAKSRVYAKSRSLPTYLTTHGIAASVALQIKKRRRVEIETVVVSPSGVPARTPAEAPDPVKAPEGDAGGSPPR